MASFLYHQEAPPLPRFEGQPLDLSVVKSSSGNFDDTMALMSSPEAALLCSPVHLDFTGSIVDWNVSSLPLDHIAPPYVSPEIVWQLPSTRLQVFDADSGCR
jgi:hypothetical protein